MPNMACGPKPNMSYINDPRLTGAEHGLRSQIYVCPI